MSETRFELTEAGLELAARLPDRRSELILAVAEAAKHAVARFQQRLQALRLLHQREMPLTRSAET
jgi:hypothetical protein